MQPITPFLWFDDNAQHAAKFYVSVFKNSKITKTLRYGALGPRKKGSVMTVAFQLGGQDFTAINGGSTYKITPAVSFVVHCRTQKEVDHYWKRLSKGGREVQCGWLTDKFGVSWQIVPNVLLDLLASEDAAKAERVTKAMFGMVKLDIKGLKAAAATPRKAAPGSARKSAAKKKK